MLRHRPFPAALRSMTFAGLATVSALASEPEATPEARAHFKAGVAHLEGKSDADAYREFKAAYAATPRWTILGHLGIAASRLERDGEAIDAMEDYLKRGGAEVTAKEKARFRQNIDRLRSGIATVTLEGPGPFWVVDTRTEPKTGSTVVNEYGPFEGRAELRVRAGEHSFELSRSEAKTSSWQVPLKPRDTAAHTFEVEPELVETFEITASEPVPAAERDTDPQSHTTAYVLWGVGALAVGASTLMYFESSGLQDKADRAFPISCPYGADPDDSECAGVLANDGKAANWRTAAMITGVGALGALVAGTVIYALDLKSLPNPAQTSKDRRPATSLRAWVSPTGLFVSGSF